MGLCELFTCLGFAWVKNYSLSAKIVSAVSLSFSFYLAL